MGWADKISFSKSSSLRSSSRSSSSPISYDDFISSSSSSSNEYNHRQHKHKRVFKIQLPKLGRDRRSSRSQQQSTDHESESDFCSPKSTAVPLPLPLPLPEGHGEPESRFPSPSDSVMEERGRDGEKERASPNVVIKSVFAGQEPRKVTKPLDTRSAKIVQQYLNGVGKTQDDFKTNGPISAPSSPFGSPVLSPQRKSTPDLFPIYSALPGGRCLRWSAPEMTSYERAGLPPAFVDLTTFGTENSPLRSPNRSPPPRSPSGAGSPLHIKLSHETSIIRRDSTGIQRENSGPYNNVHPLPLPPGAAMSAPSPTASQITPKSDVLPINSQWQKGKLIGRGTFGRVYVASNRETGALCAMKEVEMCPDDPKSAECIKQLEQEIKLLSQLKHPNIVQYYGSEIVDDKFYIYLEYVHPGSINKYSREHCGAITEAVIRSFSRHILSGLAYLHSTKTVHRDIKGANLLVDAFGVVKLADFGMAKHLTGQRADLSLKGSPYWMAPELMQAVMQKDNSSDLAFAVDIWSLGCTIIEMFNGKPPWSEYEGAAAMFKVMRDSPPIPETLSPDGKDFLRCCFRRNPAERPTAAMLLEHRFLRGSVPLDVSPSSQSLNGRKMMDKPESLRPRDIVVDHLPLQEV